MGSSGLISHLFLQEDAHAVGTRVGEVVAADPLNRVRRIQGDRGQSLGKHFGGDCGLQVGQRLAQATVHTVAEAQGLAVVVVHVEGVAVFEEVPAGGGVEQAHDAAGGRWSLPPPPRLRW